MIDLSEEEIHQVISDINNYSVSALAEKYNLSVASLQKYLCKNKISKSRVISNPKETNWTNEDKQKLLELYSIKTLEELSLEFNRSISSVKFQCYLLGLKSNSNKNRNPLPRAFWSDKDIIFLKNNLDQDINVLSYLLNRSKRSLESKLNELSLKQNRKEKTRIEVIVEDILQRNNINYIFNTAISSSFSYRPDFYLRNYNIIIECQGDYWHGNPYLYSEKELNETQLLVKWKDLLKKETYDQYGFISFFYWETDILSEDFESILLTDLKIKSPS